MTTIEPEHDAAHALEQVLHHDIPLTREMGMRVIDCRWHPTSTTRARCSAAACIAAQYWRAGAGCTCDCVRPGSPMGIS